MNGKAISSSARIKVSESDLRPFSIVTVRTIGLIGGMKKSSSNKVGNTSEVEPDIDGLIDDLGLLEHNVMEDS